ncbi:glycosyltransferase [Sulfurimonas sp.]|uniref:glycosyltransferase n=1 Tax=Sulfurimonas sp. TaxID=2022749 RepID=UPI002AAF3FC6|nr:glycosyltransferase [Sulfurimonas sp.]
MYYLSIVTVAYNNVEGLERTKESIFPLPENCEWIIVDANSTDGTSQYLAKLPTKNNIKYISEPDKGIFDGMNKGIKMASGEYIVFLNSGDMFQTDVFHKLSIEENTKSDILVYNYIPLDPNLNISNARKISIDLSILKQRSCIPHQSTLIRKDVFNKIGEHNLIYMVASDYDFFLKAYLNNISFHFDLDKYLSYFVQDGTSFKTRNAIKQALESRLIQIDNYGSYSKQQFFMYMLKYLLSFIPYADKINLLLRKLLLHKVNP